MKTRTEYHHDAATIHTVLDANLKKRLLEYGKGRLDKGIEALIEIADTKKITVTVITEVVL